MDRYCRGIFTLSLIDSTILKILSVVTPLAKACIDASCMTPPSATGSEKGIPISIKSAPASAMTCIYRPVFL